MTVQTSDGTLTMTILPLLTVLIRKLCHICQNLRPVNISPLHNALWVPTGDGAQVIQSCVYQTVTTIFSYCLQYLSTTILILFVVFKHSYCIVSYSLQYLSSSNMNFTNYSFYIITFSHLTVYSFTTRHNKIEQKEYQLFIIMINCSYFFGGSLCFSCLCLWGANFRIKMHFVSERKHIYNNAW